MARTVVFKDQMKHSERMGGQAGIFVTMLIVFFFIAHQVRNTVFFTTGFGPFEMGLFYSSIPFGIVTATARTTPGKRNEIRSLEISGGSLISWIPGLLVKVLLFTGGEVGAVAGAVYTTALYFMVRSLLKGLGGHRER